MAGQKPLKVVVVTRLYVPEVAAAAFRLKALVDGLVEHGAEVTVLTTKLPSDSPIFMPSYKLKRWPVLRDRAGYIRGYLQYLSFDIPAFFRLMSCTADVVVSEPPPTTGIVVALASLIRRRPYVYYAADIWSEALSAMDVPPVVKGVMRVVEGFVLRRAKTVIAVSEQVAGQVAKFNVPANRTVVVGNGVDTTIFTACGTAVDTEYPYFIYTGTMSEWQGAEIFVQALALLREHFPDVQLRFFGQGTDEAHLQDMARQLVPNGVHFGGVVPPEEAARWIRGASGALVSIRSGQGYDFAKPTKIYAAAGCGTPVIFAGQGAGAQIVTEGGLGIVTAYDSKSVAVAMTEVLTAALAADSSDALDQLRTERAAWVVRNASLAASGKVAAQAVLESV